MSHNFESGFQFTHFPTIDNKCYSGFVKSRIDMPGFQTKPLTITMVSGNDSRIFPRNVIACFIYVFSQSGHIFGKPKDRVPTDRKTHAVYSIPCGDCKKVYLGQTKRQFCTRLKEHQRAVSNSNSSKSASAEHVYETCHITLRGMILESLPLTIVMVNGFVWKPGELALVP